MPRCERFQKSAMTGVGCVSSLTAAEPLTAYTGTSSPYGPSPSSVSDQVRDAARLALETRPCSVKVRLSRRWSVCIGRDSAHLGCRRLYIRQSLHFLLTSERLSSNSLRQCFFRSSRG